MPRLVDHAARRRQITEAARRVVARAGLEAATFQAVAAEAEVSVRLVQYYFGNKAGLLQATHRAVIEDTAARFDGGTDVPSSARETLRTVIVSLLPLDEPRRADAVVLAAFHAAALTDGSIAPDALLGPPRVLVDVLAALIDQARGSAAGGDPSGQAASMDAELVLAAAAGLVQGVLAGRHRPEEAHRAVDHLLVRVLGPVSPR